MRSTSGNAPVSRLVGRENYDFSDLPIFRGTRRLIFLLFLLATFAINASAAYRPGLFGGYTKDTFNTGAHDAGTEYTYEESGYYSGPFAAYCGTASDTLTWPYDDKRMWVFKGEVYLEEGDYWFAECFNDNIALYIDGVRIFYSPIWNDTIVTAYNCAQSGWHTIEFRFANNGTGNSEAGATRSQGWKDIAFGLGYKVGGATSKLRADYSSFMDLQFRVDDGRGAAGDLFGVGYPANYGAVTLGGDSAYGCVADVSAGTLTIPASFTEENVRGNLASWTIWNVDPITGARLETPYASGGASDNTFEYSPSADYLRELEVTWNAEYLVSAASGSGGSVTVGGEGTSAWVAHGGSIVIEATPDAGKGFFQWTGDVERYYSRKQTFTLASLQEPRAIAAEFGNAWYVSATGSASADGRSPATALDSVSAAIEAAADGDVIFVAAGSYPLKTQIALTKAVFVRGETGDWRDVVFYCPPTNASNSRTFTGDYKVGASTQNPPFFYLGDESAVVGYLSVTNSLYGAFGTTIGGTLIGCAANDCCIINGSNLAQPVYFGGTSAIYDSYIINNKDRMGAGYSGTGTAGLYLVGSAIAQNCVISNNLISTGTGGLYGSAVVLGGSSILRNSLVAHNSFKTSGNQQGSVYVTGTACTIEGCTIIDNSSTKSATTSGDGCSGIYVSPVPSKTIIRNSIIRNNTCAGGESNFANTSAGGSSGNFQTLIIDNCNITENAFAYCMSKDGNLRLVNNCITDLPVFRDRAAGDYTLLPCACLDAGCDFGGSLGPRDLAGNERLSGAEIDIGAYEVSSAALSCGFAPDVVIGLDTLEVSFTSYVVNPTGAAIDYFWNFGDGTTSTEANPVHTFAVGEFDVTLTIGNGAASCLQEKCITVRPAEIYVALAGQSTPTPPYNTPETAFNTLAEANAFAIDGCTIILLPGNHPSVATLVIEKAITIRGLNNPVDIALGLAEGTPCVISNSSTASTVDRNRGVQVNNAGALLENVKVTKFNDGGIQVTHGTVRFCDVSANKNAWSGGSVASGGGILMESSDTLVENCIVYENLGQSNAGMLSGGGIDVKAGTVRGTLVYKNSFTNFEGVRRGAGIIVNGTATLDNCTITANPNPRSAGQSTTAGDAIGGVFIASGTVTIRNCIISGNSNATGEANIFAVTPSKVTIENTCLPTADEITKLSGATMTEIITAAAAFRDAENDDYHLNIGPCSVGGKALEWMDENSRDLAGNPLNLGGSMAIGCFEYVASELACSFAIEGETEALDSTEILFVPSIENPANLELQYIWDFGDGTVLTAEAADSQTHTFTPGEYDVTLVVTNVASEVGANFSLPACVRVTAATIYVAIPGSATPTHPYDTPQTAFTSLGDACDYANTGCTIVVLPGRHPVKKVVRIWKSITVRGLNNPIRAELCGSGKPVTVISNTVAIDARYDRLFEVLNDSCVVENMIFSANDTAGVKLENGGLIKHCIIRGNYGYVGAGTSYAGGGLWLGGKSIAEGCIIDDNQITTGTGFLYGGGVYMSGSSQLRNCIVTGNRITNTTYLSNGAGVYAIDSAVIDNCVIVGNTNHKNLAPSSSDGNGSPGVYLAASAKLRNSIVRGNTNAAGEWNVYAAAATPSVVSINSTFVPAKVSAAEVITDDPLFRDPEAHDFRLSAESPCRNAATMLDWMEDPAAADILGAKRVILGAPDIGAFESRHGTSTMLMLR